MQRPRQPSVALALLTPGLSAVPAWHRNPLWSGEPFSRWGLHAAGERTAPLPRLIHPGRSLSDLQPVQGPHPADSPSLLRALLIPAALLLPRPQPRTRGSHPAPRTRFHLRAPASAQHLSAPAPRAVDRLLVARPGWAQPSRGRSSSPKGGHRLLGGQGACGFELLSNSEFGKIQTLSNSEFDIFGIWTGAVATFTCKVQ